MPWIMIICTFFSQSYFIFINFRNANTTEGDAYRCVLFASNLHTWESDDRVIHILIRYKFIPWQWFTIQNNRDQRENCEFGFATLSMQFSIFHFSPGPFLFAQVKFPITITLIFMFSVAFCASMHFHSQKNHISSHGGYGYAFECVRMLEHWARALAQGAPFAATPPIHVLSSTCNNGSCK